MPALLLAILGVALTLAPALVSAQVAGLGVGITPAFDSPVVVGEQDQPALIQFVNNSFGPQAAVDPLTITNVRINTSCDSSVVVSDPAAPSPCPVPEPRPDPTQPVLDLDSTSLAGTTCPGGPFTITGPDAEGDYTITPTTGPFTLAPVGQPGSSCVITFTFDVIQRPTDGETFAPVALVATSPTFPGGTPTSGITRVVINQATPGLATVASPNVGFPTPPATVPVGSTVFDQATVTPVANGPAPTGTVTYALFGPGDPACAGPPIAPVGGAPQTVPVGSPSPNYVLTAAGTYNFTATYSGDTNYTAVGPIGCGDPAEQIIAAQRTVELVTQASTNATNVAPGTTVFDFATVTPTTPGPAPTGNVTYTLVGPLAPGDVTCTASPTVPPVGGAPSTVPVGSPSPSYVVTAPGTYNFIASYVDPSGTFAPAGPFGCGVPAERFTVVAPVPLVLVDKVANPTTVNEPGGNVTFTVRVTNTGPTPLTITSLNDNVYGDLATRPGSTCGALIGTTLAPGASSPACTFTGPVTGPPGTVHTNVVTVVGTAPDGQTATDDDDAVVNVVGVPPTIQVVKDATPPSLPEPGGTFTYTVRVQNTSTVESVTITSLNDNVYGDLATRPGSTCGALIGDVLAPGAFSDTCTFTGVFNGDAGDSLTDVVTATAVDDDGETATDTDDAVVTITDVLPVVRVVKTANPTTRPAPGGDFTYTVVVSNPGTETITIQSLNDSVYGNLATRPGSTCGALIGTTLAPGASSAPCTFTAPFNGAAGDSLTDVVTVVATDDDGNSATDDDDATVTLTAAPSIRVDKTADPTTLPEPGGVYTFTVVVTNTSPETLTINSLNDDIYGNVATIPGSTCGALIGTTLAPGASSAPCTFPGTFTGNAGAQQTDVVTVVGQNAAGTIVTDNDDATVRITGVPPQINVVKTANPLTRPAPGGDFTFTVVVNNPGTEAVTITSLNDDIYGDLATRPGSTCGALIGTTLAPGATSAPCTFTGPFTGVGGAQQTDVVTVTGVDDDGTTVTADDDATVTLLNVVPDIDVEKSATPSTMPAPGGTFTFNVLVTNTGPNSLTITSLTDDIYGDLSTRGTCTTAIGTVLPSGGTYSCSFPGVFNGIGGASQTDVVTVTGVDAAGTVVNANDDATVTLTNVPPTVRVVKTANPLSLPEPGGDFTFTAVVTNTSNETVTITSLTDDIYGNLATRPGSTCGALIGTTLAAGASSAPCTFTGAFFGDAGAAQTDVVTVIVTDAEGTTATDDDDAVVTITDIPPTINVVKSATPTSLPAPGGTFTFDVVVTNNSFEPITITSLVDNIYGNLAGQGTCAIGATVAPNGGTYTCSFPGTFNGAPNASQTDIVTVVGVDNDGSTVTDSDDAVVTLTGVPATLTTQASAGTVGGEVFDTATLAGGFNPTGTITFQLFGPYTDARPDDNCTSPPIFTSVKPVTGTTDPRIIVSDRFVLPSPGVYHFIASYSGDLNNPPLVTACQDPLETIGVGRIPINLSTVASPSVTLGGAIFDTATIAGGFNPTGNVTFNFYGPDNATCTGTPVFTSVKPVNGNGSYVSDSFTPTLPGLYRVVASYSGDANNASTISACDDPLEQVRVTPLPTIQVEKTANPTTLPAPGGLATFTVVVTNSSNVALTIRSLNDNVYGDITKIPNSTCNTAIGTVLAPSPGPGNTYTCTFPGRVTGAGGSTHTDVVTVVATDAAGNQVTDNDDAVVTITGVPPTIVTTKTATPASLPEPGGTFTFTLTVTNTGPDPVTITSLVDNIYGDLNGRGTCAIGARLAGNGGTYTCTFTGNFNGNAGASQTDVITTTGRDDLGQTVTSQSQATVRITDVPPTVTVVKTADPLSRPEPGGSFRFTVVVTNTSAESVTITSLVDDVYGDLNGKGSCAVGIVLPPGASYSCAFDGDFTGVSGQSQTDIVTVTVVDDDNTVARDDDDAVVTLTPPGSPPVTTPPTTVPPPPQRPPLVRTGSELAGAARVAGLMLLFGMALVVATRRFGEGGLGLATVPAGPGPRGPRGGGGGGGGGGVRFDGGGNPFGRGPEPQWGGGGTALAEAPAPAPAEPEATTSAPAPELAWDDWVGGRRPTAPPAATVIEPEFVEPVQPIIIEPGGDEPGMAPPVVPGPHVEPTPVEPEPPAVEPVAEAPEVLVPTFVPHVRSTNGLDAAALDAAQDMARPPGPARQPPGRRRRR